MPRIIAEGGGAIARFVAESTRPNYEPILLCEDSMPDDLHATEQGQFVQ
jgi:hypothetical protein